MRIRWPHHVLTVIVAAPVLALAVTWAGVFDVAASSGHWKVTEWFLHFAMRSSVRTHALGADVPPLDDPSNIQPAAAHFARGCAICHGAPGEQRSPAALRMLPPPPDLSPVVGEWTDAQLFRIVKHGVRLTGMPAWPTLDRDDEVRAMVSFLRKLPALDRQAYQELAYGETKEVRGPSSDLFDSALADCARCHGRDGARSSRLVPVIAGQREAYLVASLRAYATGGRASGLMAMPAVAATPDDWARLAQHFASQPAPTGAVGKADPDLVNAGREIAERGIPQARVPACLGCHGGQRRNPVYPRLDGQHPDYLEAQLGLFHSGQRGGTPFSHLMTTAAKGLSQDDMRAVSAYFASRTPSPTATR